MSQNMNMLYLFGFSEITGNHLERSLPLIKSQINRGIQIGIVLIHDGVIGTNAKGKISKAMEELLRLNISIFAMIPDLMARGLNPESIHNKIKPLEYDDLIEILDVTPKIISWI